MISHVVVTRFSYRGYAAERAAISGARDRPDPLEPSRLERRFGVFAFTTLPAVLAQTEQRFDWVIVIDPDLPGHYVERLTALTASRPATLLPFRPEHDHDSLAWLSGHLSPGVAITTNLDDDDSIPPDFLAAVRRRAELATTASEGAPAASAGIVAAGGIVQWDLDPAAGAPLGWKAPWHRAAPYANVGLSVYCRYPDVDACALGVRHRFAAAYLDARTPVAGDPSIAAFRRRVEAGTRQGAADWRTVPRERLFADISADVGDVLMTNHGLNDERDRLYEPKDGRRPVRGPDDFARFPIDWTRARAYLGALRR